MVNVGPTRGHIMWALLLLMVACFSSRAVLAGPVMDYITVQPIDVCGAVCAPINNLGAGKNIWSNAGTGNVGFIDPSGVNVTRAIWNQVGIDVTYMPAVQYANGSFLTVPVANCAANGTDCQSPQFQALSDQAAISQGTPPTPAPPLSQNATTINTFFIGALTPPSNQPGTLYGLAWVNNNGVAIASNSLTGAGARPDTLAHEIGHDLDLDHTTFGAGGPANLETAGNTRTLPSVTNPLSTLGKTTDQLNTTQQQPQALLSGFINPIPNVNTPITDPVAHDDFSVSFAANTGRPNEKLDTLTLAAPTGFQFDPETQFKLLNNPDGLTVHASFSNCTEGDDWEGGCSSFLLDFTGGKPFVAGDSLDYTLCLKSYSSCIPISIGNLADGTYTYNFETDADGVPVELFQTTSELTGSGDLSSGSWFPDLSIPSLILNPTTFVGFNTLPCTAVAGSCPPLELADGSPIEENPAVPEPPTVLLLLSALAMLPVACRLSSLSRPSFEAGLA
jgi:Metallo-peptidase family M12B Reprolysin-like